MKVITATIAYSSTLVIPVAVLYTPHGWYRWSELKVKKDTRNYFTQYVSHEPGIYEVRATFDRKKRIHIGDAYGKGGLHSRLEHLLNLKGGSHSHRDKILEYLIEEYRKRKGVSLSREEATYFLEVQWSTCEQPAVLELLLHLRYKPVLYDENLFRSGIKVQGMLEEHKAMLPEQDKDKDDENDLI